MTPRAGILLPWTMPPHGYGVPLDRPRDSAGVPIEPPEGAIAQEVFARYLDADVPLLDLPRTYCGEASHRREGTGAGVRPPCTGSCRARPPQGRSLGIGPTRGQAGKPTHLLRQRMFSFNPGTILNP
jgi:hypothetical protein